MRKSVFFNLLAIMMVFNFMGCDNGSNREDEIWLNLTSFLQLNGTWRYPSSLTVKENGITINTTYNNYLMTYNITENTYSFSLSGSAIMIYSGENISTKWPEIKEQQIEIMKYMEYYTFNDSNYSITVINNYTQEFSVGYIQLDESFQNTGFPYQINKDGTKLKSNMNNIEVILTKQ